MNLNDLGCAMEYKYRILRGGPLQPDYNNILEAFSQKQNGYEQILNLVIDLLEQQ